MTILWDLGHASVCSSPMLFAGLMYGVLCIGMAGLASLMGGILQVEWVC